MKIKYTTEYITLDQDQYIKNIVSRFEKSFKHQFKVKETPLPSNFVPTRKDCPTTETQTKEEREAKKQRQYLGNGKVVWTDNNIVLAQREQQVQAVTSTEETDLPF